MSNNILITGGTGFFGSYIIKALVEKGFIVRALRRSRKLPFYIPADTLAAVEWVDGDILDVVSLEEAMRGISTVIHAAAIVSFHKRDKDLMQQVNVDGTANVVNIALEQQVSRLIHISSVAALGRTATGGSVDEEKKWEESKLNTDYARTKYRAELEVWRGVSEGLDAVILNPSTILGFGDWNSSSCAIFKNIYEEFKWYAPGINGFVDVEDAARAVVAVLESNINGQRLIINGDNWAFKKLMDCIADNFGKKRPVRKTTPFLLDIAWRMEGLKSFFSNKKPLLTRESARIAISKTYFENTRLLSAIPGFSFTPLDEAIRKTTARYLAQLRQTN